jgi:hypothetical protein
MSSFPQSPKVAKGAIIGVDPFNPLASVCIFQYNPENISRTITPTTVTTPQSPGAGSEVLRLTGPPGETINLTVEIDATDQLERADGLTTTLGLYPTISSLEMLLYPKSALVIANKVLAQLGVIEIIPPQAPLTLLVWGIKRIVPVKLTSLTITEEAFDPALNPIHVKAVLALKVLTYEDFGLASVGGALSFAGQIVKEVFAVIGSVQSIGAGGAGLVAGLKGGF